MSCVTCNEELALQKKKKKLALHKERSELCSQLLESGVKVPGMCDPMGVSLLAKGL